jgi:hypothetical protein
MHIPDGLAAILVVFHDVDGVDLFPCADVRLVRKGLEMRWSAFTSRGRLSVDSGLQPARKWSQWMML